MYSDKISDIKKEDLNQIKSEVKLENIKSNFFLKYYLPYYQKRFHLVLLNIIKK